jgi:hypothetical protein
MSVNLNRTGVFYGKKLNRCSLPRTNAHNIRHFALLLCWRHVLGRRIDDPEGAWQWRFLAAQHLKAQIRHCFRTDLGIFHPQTFRPSLFHFCLPHPSVSYERGRLNLHLYLADSTVSNEDLPPGQECENYIPPQNKCKNDVTHSQSIMYHPLLHTHRHARGRTHTCTKQLLNVFLL